ncbi:hypothetical protein EWM64_g8372 [Hericium alpestre]|uniref:Uncharacterized protein n=1 Tax=Hericium alpestre TaxID=135208 RepID=A0A4Y9ZQB2_9AGAM|nr:hypothetical protein EWM64_g8372 [Hericium alpestre]
MMAIHFDPNDPNIPQILRNRFEQWDNELPRLQFSQYGPMDKYLNLKFPYAMVKPQGMLRPILRHNEDEDGLDDEAGNISIDSTGQFVSKADPKCYPDFVVVNYYDDDYDKVRLVMEIGSLQKREPASDRVKSEVEQQLHNYMALLGAEGARWSENTLGVAVLGTEVWFSKPRRLGTGLLFTRGMKWYSLYDEIFVKEIDRIARLLAKDEENEVYDGPIVLD